MGALSVREYAENFREERTVEISWFCVCTDTSPLLSAELCRCGIDQKQHGRGFENSADVGLPMVGKSELEFQPN